MHDKVNALHPLAQGLIAFLLGLVLVFAYAPFSLWWLPFLVFPALFYLIEQHSDKTTFKLGYYFGLGWFISGVGWVHVSIDQFGGLPFGISYLLMLLLAAYLALFPALTTYLSSKIVKKKPSQLLVFPSLWLISEYTRGKILSGFPWLSLGYTQTDGPLLNLAPYIGEFGICFVILSISALIYKSLNNRQMLLYPACLIAILSTVMLLGNLPLLDEREKKTRVALIQGNIPQALRWSPEENWPTMFKYQDLSRENYNADVIIWPEAAIPALEPIAREFLDAVDKGSAHNNSAIVTGIINFDFDTRRYYNGLIVLGKKYATDKSGSYFYKTNNRYYKHHLLPIGEFVPFESILRPLAPLFNLPMSSFSRGSYVQDNIVANGLTMAPAICFEIAFPEQLAANINEDTNAILTVSNDAWFGNSHGPHQHLEIAQMRAAEFGRPVIRATNNGITAIIDHRGKIQSRIPQFEEAVLTDDLTLVSGLTPFAQYGRWPVSILASLLLFCFIIIDRKQSKSVS